MVDFCLLGSKHVLDLIPCPICRIFVIVNERTSLRELGSLICIQLSRVSMDASKGSYA